MFALSRSQLDGREVAPRLAGFHWQRARPRRASTGRSGLESLEQRALLSTTVIPASADTYIRTDLDVRRNDNYGMNQDMHLGTSRGGGGIPWGGADAERSLIRFDLSGLTHPVEQAVLDLTVYGYLYTEASPPIFTVDVHRIISSSPLTPWVEGNGYEGPNSTMIGAPPGAVWTDDAYGVAWAGAGDNSDPAASNNTTQPPFDPQTIAHATVDASVAGAGTVIHWDITSLANAWIAGAPNEGIMLTDPTSDGYFRELYFGTREGRLYNMTGAVDGPQLVVTQANDTTAPSTTAALSGPVGQNGWFKGPVTVTLTATDPDNSTADLTTLYSIDGGSFTEYNPAQPPIITEDGVHTFRFRSYDSAGNYEAIQTRSIHIDQTPPTLTGTATPSTLWPPNGRMVTVTVTGQFTAPTPGSGIDRSSATFAVLDEYGQVQPSGPVTVGASGAYTIRFQLQASRSGGDLDGRTYTIEVQGRDKAGNPGQVTMIVTVPHDQRGDGGGGRSAVAPGPAGGGGATPGVASMGVGLSTGAGSAHVGTTSQAAPSHGPTSRAPGTWLPLRAEVRLAGRVRGWSQGAALRPGIIGTDRREGY